MLLGGAVAPAAAQDPPETELVSVGMAGTDSNGYSSAGPGAVTGDGRYVVFDSDASNLVPGDRNGKVDAFMRDLATGRTTRIATNAVAPEISANGRLVAYHVPRRSSCGRIVVLNRRTGERDLVPRARRNPRRPDLTVLHARFAPGGRHIVTLTARRSPPCGAKIDASDEPDYDAFALELFDRRTGRTRAVPVTGYVPSYGIAVARGGRTVALVSAAVRGGEFVSGVVAIDTRTGRETLVSVDPQERAAPDGDSPDITPDGRYVAFASSGELAPEDSGEPYPMGDVYVRDLARGTTTLVSVASDVGDAGPSGGPRISNDGRHVAFGALAGTFTPINLYVRDTAAGATRFVASGQAAAFAELAGDAGAAAYTLFPGRIDGQSRRVQEVYAVDLR
jgi:hypothetical protein